MSAARYFWFSLFFGTSNHDQLLTPLVDNSYHESSTLMKPNPTNDLCHFPFNMPQPQCLFTLCVSPQNDISTFISLLLSSFLPSQPSPSSLNSFLSSLHSTLFLPAFARHHKIFYHCQTQSTSRCTKQLLPSPYTAPTTCVRNILPWRQVHGSEINLRRVNQVDTQTQLAVTLNLEGAVTCRIDVDLSILITAFAIWCSIREKTWKIINMTTGIPLQYI